MTRCDTSTICISPGAKVHRLGFRDASTARQLFCIVLGLLACVNIFSHKRHSASSSLGLKTRSFPGCWKALSPLPFLCFNSYCPALHSEGGKARHNIKQEHEKRGNGKEAHGWRTPLETLRRQSTAPFPVFLQCFILECDSDLNGA